MCKSIGHVDGVISILHSLVICHGVVIAHGPTEGGAVNGKRGGNALAA